MPDIKIEIHIKATWLVLVLFSLLRNDANHDTRSGAEEHCIGQFFKVGLGLLFVPITTLSLLLYQKHWWRSCIYQYDETIGGSFGIAIITNINSIQSGTPRQFNCADSMMVPQIAVLLFCKGCRVRMWKKAIEAIDYSVQSNIVVLCKWYMDIFMYLLSVSINPIFISKEKTKSISRCNALNP
jgi:hypothetical protein